MSETMSAAGELLGNLLGGAKELGEGVAQGAEDAAMVANLPLRGVLWDIDLMDPQRFTLTPAGRAILAAAAVYGIVRMVGR